MVTKKQIAVIFVMVISLGLYSSCRNVRIKDHKEWKTVFQKQGIAPKDACFEMYDNNKEIAMYFNKQRCSERVVPGSTFDIFNALVALSSNVVLGDKFKMIIEDTVSHTVDSVTLKQAFKQGNRKYFELLAVKSGRKAMQHSLDTVQFGNKKIGDDLGRFFFNGNLKVTPDEMVGFIKRLYHGHLAAFDQYSIHEVQDMLLQKEEPTLKYFYRYAAVQKPNTDSTINWLVGYVEHHEHLRNPKTKKMESIPHPYFFAMNFITPNSKAQKDWKAASVDILKTIVKKEHVDD